MSTTVERNTTFRYPELPGYQITDAITQAPVGSGQKILKGTLALMDTVDGAVISAVGSPANLCRILGIAQETYDNSGGDDPIRMNQVYRRGSCFLVNSAVSPVTYQELGSFVYISDNCSVQSTNPGTNSLQVKLMSITSDGSQAEVWIF